MPSWTPPQEVPRRAPYCPKRAQHGPNEARQTITRTTKRFLEPSWPHLGATYGHRKAKLVFPKPILEPRWHQRCLPQTLTTTTRAPNKHFADYLKAPCPRMGPSSFNYPKMFNCFRIRTSCCRSCPQKPSQTQKLPQNVPLGLLERRRMAQQLDTNPKWAQPRSPTTTNSRKIMIGIILRPSWGQFWPPSAQFGRCKPILKPIWPPSCSLETSNTTTKQQTDKTISNFLEVSCLFSNSASAV